MTNFKPVILIKKLFREYLNLNSTAFDEEGRFQVNQLYIARLISYQIQQITNKNILPGKLNSFSILTGLFDYLMKKFNNELTQDSLRLANDHLKSQIPFEEFENLTKKFYQNFPDKTFQINPEKLEYISDQFEDDKFKESFIRNLILVYLSNQNKAVQDLKFIFDDEELINNSLYINSIKILEKYFDKIRVEQLRKKSILEFLLEPIIISPDNIEGQLYFIKDNWKEIIPPELIGQILIAIDTIKEDMKIFQKGFGPGETKVLQFSLAELIGLGDKFGDSYFPVSPPEEERFTPDVDWMPKVILLAKNIYVWLYQLSKKYNREINKLDQIPDEELDLIASYNFNALWLIGIWERSPASQKIKRLSGNPEALASAYSIYDYVVARDLGGEEAFENLNERCLQRGIRLACDIVPNHMGIYSKWIIDHTDYFIQTDVCPFPNYSFTGPDLSEHPDFQIRIEDKYWTRQDAAVVFQLIENKTGKIRYIYHGNDGTSMPWNDTAQLNLLKSEVREALINLIFKIAKRFSIIRLDAAMTLTQKHYQRLWYPVPGTGGSIPSRTDYSMSTEEFLRQYPKEFWREVVERINAEKPDTLLLAEAFWLMEGYFVRTLGMHRVYNSAFMNMLKNEENSKYRQLVKNTLEFNPQILKRYVNFLSNPDEETAINQFGDGDKYFGCAIMMVTMPGLPMFAHGQIEGFKEKYGHEYVRAYYDEQPNQFLIERHKNEIFPLMKKRYLFSEVENFEFYDFKNEFGEVIENVYAYSNRKGNETALIFYNNSFNTYYGYVDFSCPKNYGSSESEADKRLVSKSLGQALEIKNSNQHFYIFRETKSNLEYLRRGSDFYNERFFIELKGYEYKVFLDFIEIYDFNNTLEEVYHDIKGNGFKSIKYELIKINFSKILKTFLRELSKEKINKYFTEVNDTERILKELRTLLDDLSAKLKIDKTRFELDFIKFIELMLIFNSLLSKVKLRKSNPLWFKKLISTEFEQYILINKIYYFFIAAFVNALEEYSYIEGNSKEILRNELLNQLRLQYQTNNEIISVISLILKDFWVNSLNREIHKQIPFNINVINNYIDKVEVQNFLEVNEFENEIYFKKEKFEELLSVLAIFLLLKTINEIKSTKRSKKVPIKIEDFINSLKMVSIFINDLREFSENCGYKLNLLKEKLNSIQKN